MANDTTPATGEETTGPRFPDVHVKLTENDGNVFLIIGRVQRALLSGGATREQATEFVNEVTDANSYDAALAVVMRAWPSTPTTNTPAAWDSRAITDALPRVWLASAGLPAEVGRPRAVRDRDAVPDLPDAAHGPQGRAGAPPRGSGPASAPVTRRAAR